jgi:4-hydroxyacetophenone monooxygenase
MTRSARSGHDDADAFDDLFWEPESEAIVEDDAFLARVVAASELPVLLAALAAALGDPAMLRPDLEPPLTPMDTAPHPHGGMSAEQREQASALALEGLRRLRDGAITRVGKLPAGTVDAILHFLSGGHDEWSEMLRHELDLAEDKGGRPAWRYEDVAPDAGFVTLIVGAGVAGIAAAHRFAQAGLPFVHVEAGATVGGTWAKNSYPGVRLDTPTFGYSYSFAQRGDWPSQFAQGGEILDYLTEVADRAGVTDRIEFGTRLLRLRWDEGSRTWAATTRGPDGIDRIRRFSAVVSAVGQLDRPNIPVVPGAEAFQGVSMHSQEWDQGVDLRGKRVAVIGTGASAYQIVPAIVGEVRSLVVFQRNAPWMLPAPTYHAVVGEAFAWLQRKVPHHAQWYRLWVILTGINGRAHTVEMEDGWPHAPLSVSRRNQELRDYLTEKIAAQFDGRPDLLAHAIPGYPPGAKRMLRDNGVWAAALRDERTALVTAGLERFTPTGLVDGDGVEHQVDVVVYATGFKPSDFLDGIEVIGAGGTELHDHWAGDARAHNGVTVPGFPNLFLVYGPNVGGTVAGSLHFMLERAVEYAIEAIHGVLLRGAAAIDVRPEALDRFVAWVDAGNRRMAWGQPYVRTWYQNAAGRVFGLWPYTNIDYFDATRSVRDEDHRYLP